jgi:uncharacterized protein
MAAGNNCLKNIYLVISQGCNISCSYCYAKGGDFGKGQMLMKSGTMEKALERLLPLSEKRCNISFFGGEPLLNFDLMKETVAYGKRLSREMGMELTYSITTNGTIFDEEIISFFREHITYASVSLDGNKTVNDAHRTFREGRGIHDAVVENIKKLKEAGIRFGINATVSPDTVHTLKETVRYLSCLGATNVRVMPVIPRDNAGWKGDPLNTLVEGLKAAYIESLEMVFEGRKPLLTEHLYRVVSNVVDSRRLTLPCSAGEGILAVAANGEIYACDHFVGIDDYYMGNVFDDAIPDERFHEVRTRVSDNSVESRKRCRECRVKDICGGECHARSFMLTGDISTPSPDHCAVIKGVADALTPIVTDGLRSEEKRKRLFGFIGKHILNKEA